MRTVASEVEFPEVDGPARSRARVVAARKSRLRRMALEGLEARELLAVLPAAVPGTPINASGNPGGNLSSPQIAIDRYDPTKLVAVWVRNDPANLAAPTQVIVEGAYSSDGG